jgi:DNA polymerase V
MSFGPYPSVSLSDARKLRMAAKELLANGLNPKDERDTQQRLADKENDNTLEHIAQNGLKLKKRKYQKIMQLISGARWSFINSPNWVISPGDVWGIGRRTSKKLLEKGINSVSKLVRLNTHEIRQSFNVEVLRTIKELNGEVCKNWDETRADKQQIFSTRSVGQRIIEITTLQQALAKHTAIAAVKARQQGSLCGTLMAFAANSPFDKQPRSFKILKHFTPATNSTPELIKAINENIDSLFQTGIQYYRIGVGLLDLSSEQNQQFELFNEHKDDGALMKLLDNINQRYGTNAAFLASQGTNEKWAMRQQFLTPQYTTNWHDIPKIGC